MNALTDALEASRSKAVAALGKAYVRRDEQPDDELFRGLLHKIGLDDDVAISFLLHAWAILREQQEQPPGEQAPKQTEETATPSQWGLISSLCKRRQLPPPDKPLTKSQASEVITQLEAGTYDPSAWAVPF